MAKFYNALEGNQTDINRRFLRRIDALEKGETGETADITALKAAVGSKDTDAGSLRKRCADIEADIGVSTSGSETGIHKAIVDIVAAIGDDTSGSETGLYKAIADLVAAIGDESTADSILGRIKALEDAE